jgi:hypothetical protein
MVHNLARENEASLRARGHAITAGRLYLAHFLGPGSVHAVLSADSTASLLDLLSAEVISANPFLTGKDAAWIIDWAERKMAKRGKESTPTATVKRANTWSKAFLVYKVAIDRVLEAMEGNG